MRPISGRADEALTTPAADCRELIPGADFDGQHTIFHLRGIIITNSHVSEDSTIQIYDQDEGAAVATNEQFAIIAPDGVTTMVEFSEPGWLFHTNITAAATLGTIAIYQAGAWGFLEGGQ